MNILTDADAKEIHRVLCATVGADYLTIAKAASDFTIKKLAAGVSVEPYATLHHDDGYFTTKQREHDLRYSGPMRTEVVTLDQLNTALAAARVQENERCAQFCHPSGLAYGIRALLGKEDQS